MSFPLRYARYQLRDTLTHRLALPLLLIALVTGLPAYVVMRNSPADFFQGPQGATFAMQLYTQSTSLFLPLGAFLCAVGAASADRHHGYFRLLFSKPQQVPAYYLQLYVVAGLAFILMFGAITWAVGAMTVRLSVLHGMESAALTWVLVGGLGMLFGALTRFDAAVLVATYVLALLLQQIVAAPGALAHGGLPRWLGVLGSALPPVRALDQLRDQLYAAQPLDPVQLWYVLGYGAVALAAGVLWLRRAPLAR